jgi:adenylate cyclase
VTTSQRKLFCILAADVAGYSRLMSDDEFATERTLHQYRQVFTNQIRQHQGRVVDTAGDSVLAVFESPVEAMECAVEIQKDLARRNRQLADHRRMEFRIGLNLGDIITREDGSVYGDAVNIGARLQALAEAGGICISANVLEQVDRRLPLRFADLGEQQVKNIDRPVRAYKVQLERAAVAHHTERVQTVRRRRMAIGAGLLISVVAGGSVGVLWWRNVRHASEIAAPHRIPEKPTIAVLPFANLSSDTGQDYLSDGITEDVITALARFSKLSVVARNSTFVYKGKAVDVRQVGKDLGVRYVLEGSVRRSGNRARVTAQLIDASDGTHLWAENYDRELKDLFSVQDEVIQQIVGRLDVELDRAQLEQLRRTSPKDFKAYDLVLQARKLIYEHSESNHRASRELLERAIAIDENLAPAYIELAWVYLDEFRFGWNARPNPLDRALKAASRAVELEPNNGFAHWRLAKVLFFRKQLDRFDSETKRALSLNPNHAETMADVAIHIMGMDRVDEAYELAQRALRLDPNFPSWIYFVHVNYFYRKHRYREALAAVERINMPDFYWTHFWFACSYAKLGNIDRARAEGEDVVRLKPDFALVEEANLWNWAPEFLAYVSEGAAKAGVPLYRSDRR